MAAKMAKKQVVPPACLEALVEGQCGEEAQLLQAFRAEQG